MSLTAQLQLARLRGLSPDEAGLSSDIHDHLAGALVDAQPEDVSSLTLNLILREPPEEILRAVSQRRWDVGAPDRETELIAALHHPHALTILSSHELSEQLQMLAEDGRSAPLTHLLGLLACHAHGHLTAQLRGGMIGLSDQHRHLAWMIARLDTPAPPGREPLGPQETRLRQLVAGLAPENARSAPGTPLMWQSLWREAAWQGGRLEGALRPVQTQSASWNLPPPVKQRRLTCTPVGALWIDDHFSSPLPDTNLRQLTGQDEADLRPRLIVASVPLPARHPDPECAWQAALLCASLSPEGGPWSPVTPEERLMLATSIQAWPDDDHPHHPVRLIRQAWIQADEHDRPALRAGLRLAERLTRIHSGDDAGVLREGDPLNLRLITH